MSARSTAFAVLALALAGCATVLALPAVDEIDHAAANALDGGNIEFHRPDLAGKRLGTIRKRARMRLPRVPDPKRHRTG